MNILIKFTLLSISLCTFYISSVIYEPSGAGASQSTPFEANRYLTHSHVPAYEDSSSEIDKFQKLNQSLLSAIINVDLLTFLRLIKNGASVNATDKMGETALHYAARGNTRAHQTMVIYLLAFGANATQKNRQGLTPVHYATYTTGMLKCFFKVAQI